MGCGKGKRVRRDGSSWYHTLVNCDQVLDTTGGVHYPMKEIFVRYLEKTDAATMTAHVRHLAKTYRTQIQGGARKYGGGQNSTLNITRPILENNSAFESSHRVTCHVILRFT